MLEKESKMQRPSFSQMQITELLVRETRLSYVKAKRLAFLVTVMRAPYRQILAELPRRDTRDVDEALYVLDREGVA